MLARRTDEHHRVATPLELLYDLTIVVAISTAGIPWHPHHIAERYSLLAIISLGEIILGTTIAVQEIVAKQGWSPDAILVAAAGVSIAVGVWWVYFGIPFGECPATSPVEGVLLGYSHIALYAAIAAVGAGLHVAAYCVERENVTTISLSGTVLAIAVPLALTVALLYWLVHRLLPGHDPVHLVLGALTLAGLAAAVAMAFAGASLGICLLVLILVPWISVVGYEKYGHAHLAKVLEGLREEA